MAIGDWFNLQPLSPPQWFPPFNHKVNSPGNQPLSLGDSNSHLISNNSGVVERVFLMNIKAYLYLLSLRKFQGF